MQKLQTILTVMATLAYAPTHAAATATADRFAAAKPSAFTTGGNAKASPGKSSSAAGPMQVEEPSAAEGNTKVTDPHARAKGLTEQQKQAFRQRKEKMQEMMALIKAKRHALQNAKPEERAALARELHSLILEKNPDDAGSSPAVAAASNGPVTDARMSPGDKSPGGNGSASAPGASASAPGNISGTAPGSSVGTAAATGTVSDRDGDRDNARRRNDDRAPARVERPRDNGKRTYGRDDEN